MGIGQSLLQSATDEQKERYGLFQLRTSQAHALEAMTDLFRQLVGDPADTKGRQATFLDLQSIAGTPETCDSLFVVSTARYKKEFQMMRFPDPMNPSVPDVISFMPKKAYEDSTKNIHSPRKFMCEQIGFFTVRLVTLVGALLSSVIVHKDMTSLLFTQKGAVPQGINELYFDPVLPEPKETEEGISSSIINSLIEGRAFHRAKADGKEDMRPLFFFGNKDSVVINAKRGLVYAPQKLKTGVLRIEIEEFDAPASRVNRLPVGYAMGYPMGHPAMGYGPPVMVPSTVRSPYESTRTPTESFRPATANPTTTTLSPRGRNSGNNQTRRTNRSVYAVSELETGKRKIGMPGFNRMSQSDDSMSTTASNLLNPNNRRGGGGRRTTRRHRTIGGAKRDNRKYLVTLSQFLECEAKGCAEVGKFIMDETGTTYDYREYIQSLKNISSLLKSSEFHERVGSFLKLGGSVKTIPPSAQVLDRTLTRSSFAPLGKLDTDVYKRLVTLKKTILSGQPEGYSPASYRAFLLASQLESDLTSGERGTLNSLFCNDAWQNLELTSTASYSLLQSLFKDLTTGNISSRSASECESYVQQQMAVSDAKTSAATRPTKYEDLVFQKIPKSVESVCNKQKSGPRPISSESQKRILLDAHRDLRGLYDEHLSACIELLRRVLFFGSGASYMSLPRIQLDSELRRHPRGSQYALDEKIAEARALIARHYIQVETVYKRALDKLGAIATGERVETPSNTILIDYNPTPRTESESGLDGNEVSTSASPDNRTNADRLETVSKNLRSNAR